MAIFSRRERPPEQVLDALDAGERVLSWADADDGAQVFATPRGVWWPEGSGGEGWRLIRWQYIDKATWRDGWLAVTEADVVDDLLLVDRPAVTAKLQRPRDLPPTIRKRVEANVVRSELLTIAGGAVRFVARKQPGKDGVMWWARLEHGTRDCDEVRSAVRARLTILRTS